MYRPDGSYDSANNPTPDNRFGVLDFGIYTAQVMEVTYPDDLETSVDNDQQAPEVTYTVMIVGGHRDGQTFNNAVRMSRMGGNINYDETVLKKVTTLLQADPASLLFNFDNLNKLNGDIVYIQFINGDLRFPLIVGSGRHPDNQTEPAQTSDGQRKKSSFNGITKEINKDGEVTWTKANGFYSPLPFPTATGQILQDSWVPLPGFEEAVQVTLGNEFNFLFKMNVTPGTGMEVAIDGVADELKVTTLAGSSVTMNGLSDSLEYTTLAGMAVKVDGLSDKFSLTALTGASVEVDGLGDKISLATSAGGSLVIDGLGLETTLQNTSGAKLTLSATEASLLDTTGAGIKVSNGLIAIGNASGELLDLIDQAFTALSTQTAAGFGAPTSTVGNFVQLAVLIKLLKGSL